MVQVSRYALSLIDGGKPDRDHASREAAAQPQSDPRSERKPGERERQPGIALAQIIERRARILQFPFALVVSAFAQIHAAIVEPQHDRPGARNPRAMR